EIDNNDATLRTYYIDLSNANWNNISNSVPDSGEQTFSVSFRNNTSGGDAETAEIHHIEFMMIIPRPEVIDYTFTVDEEGWILNGTEDASAVSGGVWDITLPAAPVSNETVEMDQLSYQISDASLYDYVNITYRNQSANDEIRFQFRSSENNYSSAYGVNVTPEMNMVAPNFHTIQIDLNTLFPDEWDGVVNEFRILIRNEQIQIDDPGTYPQDVTTSGNFIIDRIEFTSAPLATEKIEKNDASLTLYPNPVNNVLSIHATNRIEKVEIFNMLGQKVKTEISNTIDVSNLSNGMYVSKIYQENNIISTKRFVKK
ncbi:MAG: T9SS type A sorting domain-containing protein, partial [Urechidicola sp.]|nr:T9SS type A sorting domain-containing protein [Urechidicola sp.]